MSLSEPHLQPLLYASSTFEERNPYLPKETSKCGRSSYFNCRHNKDLYTVNINSPNQRDKSLLEQCMEACGGGCNNPDNMLLRMLEGVCMNLRDA